MLGDVVVQDFGSRAREAVPSLFGLERRFAAFSSAVLR